MSRHLIKNDKAIARAAAVANGKRTRLGDGDRLTLVMHAHTAGAHVWQFDYVRPNGGKNSLSLGTYPAISIEEARAARDAMLLHLKAGIDPSDVRKAEKASGAKVVAAKKTEATGEPTENSLAHWTKKYHDFKYSPNDPQSDWGASTARQFTERMDRHILPVLGQRAIGDIEWREVYVILEVVQNQGHREQAHTLLSYCDAVWQQALKFQAIQINVVRTIKGMLKSPKTKSHPAIKKPEALVKLIRAMDAYGGAVATRTVLKLGLLTFQRPYNLVSMEWAELHLKRKQPIWIVPAIKMKGTVEEKLNGEPHEVPLSKQAVEALQFMHRISGRGRYVFPGERDHEAHMNENTPASALRRMGFEGEQRFHSMRSTAMTMIIDHVRFIDGDQRVQKAWVDAALAHGKDGPLGDTYDRSSYMAERPAIAQAWADYCDRVCTEVTPENAEAVAA